MVAFSGLARPDDGTEELFLEAYEPMALAGMNDIERAAREKWALRSVAIRHRLGAVHVGEPVVFVVTAAEHRRQAFESAQWIMDELKRSVPIWKKEIVERRSNRGRWVHPGAPGP
jgi:molybdopterin synthase catalytic subunit